MVSPTNAVDWNVWRQLFGLQQKAGEGRPLEPFLARIEDIVATYLEESGERQAALSSAFLAGELSRSQTLARALKGLSAGIGARRLAELAHLLEAALTPPVDRGSETPKALFNELKAEGQRVELALKNWRTRLLAS